MAKAFCFFKEDLVKEQQSVQLLGLNQQSEIIRAYYLKV